MKELPILFAAPMVRAILYGRKTQTRRVGKFPPGGEYRGLCIEPLSGELHAIFAMPNGDVEMVRSPYGKRGDVLWVQEGFRVMQRTHFGGAAYVEYRADGAMERRRIAETHYDKPSSRVRDSFLSGRFCPRWASRLLLEVVDVRVGRVRDISPADIDAEGIGHSIKSMVGPTANRLKTWPLQWVHGPDVDESIDYCYPCCTQVVKSLQKADPDRADEYCVGGGWDDYYESDSPRMCDKCGRVLGVSYTDYACEVEIGHYLDHSCNLSRPDDCYYLERILECQTWGEGRQADDLRRACWRAVWDHINAKRGYPWASDPYVWVVGFKRKDGAA